jgi:cytochrome b subunit of formate dehydrogenase
VFYIGFFDVQLPKVNLKWSQLVGALVGYTGECTLINVHLLLLYIELFINTRIWMSLRRTHWVSEEEEEEEEEEWEEEEAEEEEDEEEDEE